VATPPSRTPPRFVPTLTEVVRVPDTISVQQAAPAAQRTTVSTPAAPSVSAAVQSAAPLVRPALPDHRPAAAPQVAAVAPRPDAAPARPFVGASAQTQKMPPAAGSAPPTNALKTAQASWPKPLPEGIEEHMVHRVMQRVDVVLDQRLREAIATVVQEQTRSVLPRLREEIESVVRHAVYEAVADELAAGASTAPRR